MGNILDDPEAKRFLRNEALELADAHPGLDVDRTVVVLARTAYDAHGPMVKWPERLPSKSGIILYPPIVFSPSIGLALRNLKPEEALSLFEQDDKGLEMLRRRQVYVDYLGSGDAPLFTPIDPRMGEQDPLGVPGRLQEPQYLLGREEV